MKLNCHSLDKAYVRKVNKIKPTPISKYVKFVRAK